MVACVFRDLYIRALVALNDTLADVLFASWLNSDKRCEVDKRCVVREEGGDKDPVPFFMTQHSRIFLIPPPAAVEMFHAPYFRISGHGIELNSWGREGVNCVESQTHSI
mmetsp:Transcript_15454/g.33475  ORF Transcript_15454/g.33475 Transcript_15454/m.33475 type:complete len:109 (-) Transcript_15454:1132-1458(-)